MLEITTASTLGVRKPGGGWSFLVFWHPPPTEPPAAWKTVGGSLSVSLAREEMARRVPEVGSVFGNDPEMKGVNQIDTPGGG